MMKLCHAEITPAMCDHFAALLEEWEVPPRGIARSIGNIKNGYRVDEYGSYRKLHDWLWSQYGAAFVREDKRNVLRFASEDQRLLFVLQYG